MEYRSLDFNDIKGLKQSPQVEAKRTADGAIDTGYYIAKARAERATVAVTGLKRAAQAVARLFG